MEPIIFSEAEIRDYENFFRSKLFPHEIMAYEKGLKHVGGAIAPFLGMFPDQVSETGTIDLNIQEFPQLLKRLPLARTPENCSEEDVKVMKEFWNVIFKIQIIFSDFLVQDRHLNLAIEHLQMMISNIEKLSDRMVGDIDQNETIEYLSILNRKKGEVESLIKQRDLQIQIESTPNLFFQKNDAILDRLSKKLQIDGITEQPLGFYNVFKQHSKCFITESEADRFVALLYYMIEMQPPLITTDGKKAQGVVGRAKQFFCNNSAKGVQSISFPDRMGRLRKDGPRKVKIDEFVIKFMKEF